MRVARSAFPVALISIILVALAVRPAEAQQHPNSATATAQKSRGEAGEKDENIKKDRQPNDLNTKIEAPPEKGGPKGRSSYCRVHFDNRTPWYIDLYTDGNYRGEISPFDDLYGWVGCGETSLYGRATFRGGSVQTWGPSAYDIGSEFTWHLNP